MHPCLLPHSQINQYQPNTGATSCSLCPAGYSTQDDGNTECQPCPVGYYSPNNGVCARVLPPGCYMRTCCGWELV